MTNVVPAGQEVVKMFELYLEKNGYYRGYDDGVDPTVANAFATAAFRFGHSLVPNTFVRADSKHRHIFNSRFLKQFIPMSKSRVSLSQSYFKPN